MHNRIDLTNTTASHLDDVFQINAATVATSFGDQAGQFLFCVVEAETIIAFQTNPQELEELIERVVDAYDPSEMALAVLDGHGFVQLKVSHYGKPPLKSEALGRFTDDGIDWVQLTSLEPETFMHLATG